jgi:Flp pilus assembly protein TadD
VALKKEQAAFLIGGLAFGFLFGYLAGDWAHQRSHGAPPAATGEARQAAPQGAQSGGGSSAPMLQEIASLRRVIEQQPDNLQALTRLANLYHDAQMWNEAIGFYERALEVSPGDPNLMTDMGICFQGLQQFERALELFRTAHASHPDHWQSLYNTAVVSGLRMGRFDDAYAALDRLQQFEPARPYLEQLRRAIDDVRAGGETPPS